MKQKELAREMDLTPVQTRNLINSLRHKRKPVTARNGMALCYDPELVMKEAQALLNHGRAEIEVANSLMLWVLEGESDDELTQQEELLLSKLPIIEAPKEERWDSSEQFPFLKEDGSIA